MLNITDTPDNIFKPDLSARKEYITKNMTATKL